MQIIQNDILGSLFDRSATAEDYSQKFLLRFSQVVEKIDTKAVAKLAYLLDENCRKGRQAFFFGNGGSAAVASHLVADLCANSIVEGEPCFRAQSLADNAESILAIANDSGYENIFLYQLKCHLNTEDLVVGLSVSGNSQNVIRALEYARNQGACTVGMTGFDGGRVSEIVDLSIHIPTTRDEYGPVEDLFSCIGHIVTGYLTMKRGRQLSHGHATTAVSA